MKFSAFRTPPSALGSWLPDMDLNHDKQIQSLLCYRYTIGQAGAPGSVCLSRCQSSQQSDMGDRGGLSRPRRGVFGAWN